MTGFILSIVLAYLIGAIPTSVIFGRVLKGVDIREHGSKNAGATNVFRVVGRIPGIIVLVLDIFKGFFAAAFLPALFCKGAIGNFITLEACQILLGTCAIAGHVFSVFLKMKGGKGVATTAGVMIALAPKVVGGSALVWVVVFSVFRIVSVASVAASVCLPVFAVIFSGSVYTVIFTAILAVCSIYKHKPNLKRLVRGEEKKLF